MDQPEPSRAPRRIRRIGYVALNVTDLQRSLDFYTRVANLAVVEQGPREVHLRAVHEHHAVVLRQADRAGVAHVAFETDDDAATEALRADLARRGVPVREAPETPGRLGLAFQLQDPDGIWMEVYRAQLRRAGLISPGPFEISNLGHFTFGSRDVPTVTEFYRTVGFRVSDQQGPALSFLRCNRDHHALAFLGGGQSFLHHLAFNVGDFEGIKRVLDWCGRQQWAVGAGPVRHPQGDNIALYVPDPDGTFVEYYAELELIDDDEDHARPDYLADAAGHTFFDLWGRNGPPPYFLGLFPRDGHGKPLAAAGEGGPGA